MLFEKLLPLTIVFFLLVIPLASSTTWSSSGQFSQGNIYFYSFLDGYLWNLTSDNSTVYLNEGQNINISGSYYGDGSQLTNLNFIGNNCSGLNSCSNILYVNNISDIDTDTRWIISGPYLFNNSGTLDFNETKLNATINDISGGGGSSVSNVWNVSGDYVFLINESKKVGIGTTTPSNKLEVYGGDVKVSGSSGDFITLDYTGGNPALVTGGGSALNLKPDSGIVNVYESGSEGRFQIYDGSSGYDVVLRTAGSSYLNGGNVGIGTSSPDELLSLFATNPNIYLDATSNAKLILDKGSASKFNGVEFQTVNDSQWIIGTPDSDLIPSGDSLVFAVRYIWPKT